MKKAKMICSCIVLSLVLAACGQSTEEKHASRKIIQDVQEVIEIDAQEDSEKEEVEIEEIEEIEEKEIEEKEEIEEEVKEEPKEQPKEEITSELLSNEKKGWSFKRNSEHRPIIAYTDFDVREYGGYYLGNTGEKVIYLTFDNGYENGYTPTILDTLKENDVKAIFFVTKSYIKYEPELVKRMKDEGHLVGNHSVTHPSFPEISDEQVAEEILDTESYMEEMTGYKMDTFFRPPMGEYSERTLKLTNDLGYKSIFWSLTYKDWDVKNQLGKQYAYDHVINNIHPGAIPLLHAVSSSNTEALDDIIKEIKKEGYSFGSLYDLK